MASRKPSEQAASARILLVDDNANGLKARKTLLEELGYRIATACCGDDALELFAPQKFDLLVTDYKMPRMDGLELISRIRKKTPGLPIILVSGYVDTLGLNEENTGADAVIQKSANEVSHLTRAVSRLLRQKPGRKPTAREGVGPKVKRQSV